VSVSGLVDVVTSIRGDDHVHDFSNTSPSPTTSPTTPTTPTTDD